MEVHVDAVPRELAGAAEASRAMSPTAWASGRASTPSRSPGAEPEQVASRPLGTSKVTRSASDRQSGRPRW